MDFRDELFDDDDGEFDFDSAGDDGIPVQLGQVIGEEDDFDDFSGTAGDGRILGMTAFERAFLSIILFFNVLILGFGMLLATGRI